MKKRAKNRAISHVIKYSVKNIQILYLIAWNMQV
jgi:hypothetical protein